MIFNILPGTVLEGGGGFAKNGHLPKADISGRGGGGGVWGDADVRI